MLIKACQNCTSWSRSTHYDHNSCKRISRPGSISCIHLNSCRCSLLFVTRRGSCLLYSQCFCSFGYPFSENRSLSGDLLTSPLCFRNIAVAQRSCLSLDLWMTRNWVSSEKGIIFKVFFLLVRQPGSLKLPFTPLANIFVSSGLIFLSPNGIYRIGIQQIRIIFIPVRPGQAPNRISMQIRKTA